MGYTISATELNANTGHYENCKNTQTAPSGIILVKRGFEIATEALAKTKATWVTASKAAEPNRSKIINSVLNMTPEDTENIMVESPFIGGRLAAYGKTGMTFECDVNAYEAKELAKLNTKDWSGYLFDPAGWIEGISVDGVKFLPRKILTFQVLPTATPEANQLKTTKIKISFGDTEKYMNNRVIINPTMNTELSTGLDDWDPNTDLDGVHNVALTVPGAWAATGGNVDVKFSGSGLGVSGLVSADFAISGEVITATESATVPGRYAIAGTTIASGTINLVACSAISLTAYAIESTGSVAFTVA